MEHVTEVHTLSIRTDDVDCERTWYTENISKITFAREKVVSANNHFSGAGFLMCITREWYELSRSGLHHYVQRRCTSRWYQYLGI